MARMSSLVSGLLLWVGKGLKTWPIQNLFVFVFVFVFVRNWVERNWPLQNLARPPLLTTSLPPATNPISFLQIGKIKICRKVFGPNLPSLNKIILYDGKNEKLEIFWIWIYGVWRSFKRRILRRSLGKAFSITTKKSILYLLNKAWHQRCTIIKRRS